VVIKRFNLKANEMPLQFFNSQLSNFMKIHSVVLRFLYTDKQTYTDSTSVAAVLCKDINA